MCKKQITDDTDDKEMVSEGYATIKMFSSKLSNFDTMKYITLQYHSGHHQFYIKLQFGHHLFNKILDEISI